MNNQINPEAIVKLIQLSKEDGELLEFIAAALNSFEGLIKRLISFCQSEKGAREVF